MSTAPMAGSRRRSVFWPSTGDTAFAVLDGIEPEGQEVAEALVEHLRRRWPERFGDVALDGSTCTRSRRPVAGPRRPRRDGRARRAARVRWRVRVLPEPLGPALEARRFDGRGPRSPWLGSTISWSTGSTRFLDRLRPERSFWRLGWGIIDLADGYTPADGTGAPRPVDPDVSTLFVRVERETLRRFPGSGCVLFTIRTYVAPITSVMADDDSARALADAVAAMSPTFATTRM